MPVPLVFLLRHPQGVMTKSVCLLVWVRGHDSLREDIEDERDIHPAGPRTTVRGLEPIDLCGFCVGLPIADAYVGIRLPDQRWCDPVPIPSYRATPAIAFVIEKYSARWSSMSRTVRPRSAGSILHWYDAILSNQK